MRCEKSIHRTTVDTQTAGLWHKTIVIANDRPFLLFDDLYLITGRIFVPFPMTAPSIRHDTGNAQSFVSHPTLKNASTVEIMRAGDISAI